MSDIKVMANNIVIKYLTLAKKYLYNNNVQIHKVFQYFYISIDNKFELIKELILIDPNFLSDIKYQDTSYNLYYTAFSLLAENNNVANIMEDDTNKLVYNTYHKKLNITHVPLEYIDFNLLLVASKSFNNLLYLTNKTILFLAYFYHLSIFNKAFTSNDTFIIKYNDTKLNYIVYEIICHYLKVFMIHKNFDIFLIKKIFNNVQCLIINAQNKFRIKKCTQNKMLYLQ